MTEQEHAPGSGENLSDQTDPSVEPAPQDSMESLLEQSDLTIDFPRPGESRTGIIVSISPDEVLVSIGTKSEGIIPRRELEQLEEEERAGFKLGQEITVYVVTPEDQQGNLLLSYTRAIEEQDWLRAEELLQSNEVFEGAVDGFNKGGLIVQLGRLRGFVPGSQVSLSRRMAYSGSTPDQRWGKMVGQPIATRVIEVDRERRRLILSERAALQEARELLKERLLDELEVGEVRNGRVTSLADFGAFVNINGADGLVHLTEISWERINHPSEVLKVGEEVQVKVIDVDRERKRIGLSIRQLQDDPWPQKVSHLKVGQLIEGHIVRLVKFGAFARIGDLDVEGLIHISELSDQRIEHPKEVLQESDTVTLRIINIDEKRRRIGLSLRKVDSPAYADRDWELALAEDIDAQAPETGEGAADEELSAMGAALVEAEIQLEEPAEAPAALDEEEASAEAEIAELDATSEAQDEPEAAETVDMEAETAVAAEDEEPAEAATALDEEPEASEAAETVEMEVETAEAAEDEEPAEAATAIDEEEASAETEIAELEAASEAQDEPEATEIVETEPEAAEAIEDDEAAEASVDSEISEELEEEEADEVEEQKEESEA